MEKFGKPTGDGFMIDEIKALEAKIDTVLAILDRYNGTAQSPSMSEMISQIYKVLEVSDGRKTD